MPSFTLQVPDIERIGPVVEVRLAVDSALEHLLVASDQPIPDPVITQAMVDTGASISVVRDDIPQQLGINPVGVIPISTSSSTNVLCPEYLVRLFFPNQIVVEATAIAAPLLGQNIQCLIGRDVLKHGVFIYNGYAEMFTLSF